MEQAMKAHTELVRPYLHLFSEPDSNGDVLWLQIIKEGLKPVSYTHLDVYKRQHLR